MPLKHTDAYFESLEKDKYKWNTTNLCTLYGISLQAHSEINDDLKFELADIDMEGKRMGRTETVAKRDEAIIRVRQIHSTVLNNPEIPEKWRDLSLRTWATKCIRNARRRLGERHDVEDDSPAPQRDQETKGKEIQQERSTSTGQTLEAPPYASSETTTLVAQPRSLHAMRVNGYTSVNVVTVDHSAAAMVAIKRLIPDGLNSEPDALIEELSFHKFLRFCAMAFSFHTSEILVYYLPAEPNGMRVRIMEEDSWRSALMNMVSKTLPLAYEVETDQTLFYGSVSP